MSHRDLVSVIIPTYNRASYLVQSLESVLAQTYLNLEVIVVNDGSTDETKTLLEPYHDRISYLEKENGGKSSAVNLGLKYISGDYVWVFDDDDIALPEMVESHMLVFESQPDVGFVYGGYAFFDGDDPSDVIEAVDAVLPPEGRVLGSLLNGNFISSVSVVVRKQCYDRVGCYDERVRRAMTHLTPRKSIIRNLIYGLGVTIDGPVHMFRPEYHGGRDRGIHVPRTDPPSATRPVLFLQPKFTGREREKKALREILRDTGRGVGRMVLVSGEAGIGKSELLEEFQADAHVHGTCILNGCCYESGGRAYGPFMEALEALADRRGIEGLDLEKDVERVLSQIERPANGNQTDPYALMEILCEFLGYRRFSVSHKGWNR